MNKPTLSEICDEQLQRVFREEQSGWRHGVERYDVYKRISDSTYWAISYRVSTDGETNELRDEECDQPTQVEPYEKTVISYRLVEP